MAKKVMILILVALLATPLTTLAADTSCAQCHRSQPGSLGEPVKQWEGSVHQRNGINCSSCHGGDPTLMSMEAMSPEKGFRGVPEEEEIPGFCGSCHVGVKDDYLQSAHGQALGVGGPTCVTCHGNHAVELASLEIINRDLCTQCHEYGRAEEIKSAMARVDQKIANLQDEAGRLHKLGFTTEEMKNRIFSVRNQFHQLFHTVDVEKVRSHTAGFLDKLSEIQEKVSAMEQELSHRKLIGGGVVVVLAVLTVLLALLRKTYKDEEKKMPPPGSPGIKS